MCSSYDRLIISIITKMPTKYFRFSNDRKSLYLIQLYNICLLHCLCLTTQHQHSQNPKYYWVQTMQGCSLKRLIMGPSWSSSYGSLIYNYQCFQCLSPLPLWVRIPLMARCTRYNIVWKSLSVTCGSLVVFSEYSGFLLR
jgi:hypothetical protein